MTLFKKCQTFFNQTSMRFIVQWLLSSHKNMSLLEQLGRKMSCWSAGVLLFFRNSCTVTLTEIEEFVHKAPTTRYQRFIDNINFLHDRLHKKL